MYVYQCVRISVSLCGVEMSGGGGELMWDGCITILYIFRFAYLFLVIF